MRMNNYLKPSNPVAIPIFPFVAGEHFTSWLNKQTPERQNWLQAMQFNAKPGSFLVVPNKQGAIESVLLGLSNANDFWELGALPAKLPIADYRIDDVLAIFNREDLWRAHLAWALGSYRFDLYKKTKIELPSLAIDKSCDLKDLELWQQAYFQVRDLINLPAADLGPLDLAKHTEDLAQQFKAKVQVIEGEALEKQGFNAIYQVGKGASRAPCLVDMTWGDKSAPKVTLVGKGICFDSGGLDIKNAPGMLLMKKDMGGAALCLGLAHLIMAKQLPIRLRVILACAENSVDGNSYRPGDVIRMRNGLSVEITNTDAEGRLVLADGLAYACEEKPDLLFNFATLTGAARVALGPDLPVIFANHQKTANDLLAAGEVTHDYMWQLPLHQRYKNYLNSSVADIANASSNSFAGTIVAALFLQQFVDKSVNWLHMDTFSWNQEELPGRPKGGEALALRALFHYLVESFV